MRMGRKVFVVDDEVLVAKGFARLLESGGYETEIFTSPLVYLAGAPRLGPGCGLIDLHMPEMSGLALQEALKKVGCTLPIIFISGNPDIRDVRQGLREGAKAFLKKPVTRDELLQAVGNAIV